MKGLHKKIGVGVLAVGLLVSGGFSQSVINASASSSEHLDESHLFVDVSPQRVEDLRSIIRLGEKLFNVLEADPSYILKRSLKSKCDYQEKSIGNNEFIRRLREVRDLGKDEALKKLGFKSNSYYLLRISDDSNIKDEEVDDLEILIYVF